jgi:hypothetical protein
MAELTHEQLWHICLRKPGDSHRAHTRGWLLQPLDFVLHGWPLVAANVVFYGYLCWLAFWFIRGTHGRERVVMVGWFAKQFCRRRWKFCGTSGPWRSDTYARSN